MNMKYLGNEHINDFARMEKTVAEIIFREEVFRLWNIRADVQFSGCDLNSPKIKEFQGGTSRIGRHDLAWIAKVLAYQAVEKIRRGVENPDFVRFACNPVLQIDDEKCSWFVYIWVDTRPPRTEID